MGQVREGQPVFIHDGDIAIGAVRRVLPGQGGIVVYIENAGEFTLSADAVRDVHFDKVVLNGAKLDQRVHDAIGRAHRSEDPDNSKSHEGEG